MTKVKRLQLDKPEFMANGHKYILTEDLSVERWRKFEDYQALVGLGRSFQDVYEEVKNIYEALQKPNVADAAVLAHNILKGIKDKLDNRHHPALMICALFINREGEESADYDEKLMYEKVEDWKIEGYAVQDFFQLAWNFVPGFINVFNEDLEATLAEAYPEKSGLSSKKK